MPFPVEQAGAVVYRRDAVGLRVLLVRARRNPTDWIFPKGHIEPGEPPTVTAVREAAEEAGVEGHVVAALPPPLTFQAGGREFRVDYFLVEFERDVPPAEERESVWLAPGEARARLTHESARGLLDRALARLHDRTD